MLEILTITNFTVNIMFAEEDEGWVRDRLRPTSIRRTAAGIQQDCLMEMMIFR